MKVLIIGGTRNLGHFLAVRLLATGHRVGVLNRGRTRDDLPATIERLRADRCDARQLRGALGERSFDAVIDTALYRGREAEEVVGLLEGRVGHYVFISTGQVYLVRSGLKRPFREENYEGLVDPEPDGSERDVENWGYGIEKREAEDVLAAAWQKQSFPVTSLRLPMVASERDHFGRVQGYLLRIRDGGPLLLPPPPRLLLRHVYVHDVVSAIERLIASGEGKGRAYNLSQDETLTLEAFLDLLAEAAGCTWRSAILDPRVLAAHGLIPDCSPFSDPWMSELDNARSKRELLLTYTPVTDYLKAIVAHHDRHDGPRPSGYARRAEELTLAEQA
jgi:nucleoside-diphosphate-sugar epimerase